MSGMAASIDSSRPQPPELMQVQIAHRREQVRTHGREHHAVPGVPNPEEGLRSQIVGKRLVAAQVERKPVYIAGAGHPKIVKSGCLRFAHAESIQQNTRSFSREAKFALDPASRCNVA
jgi:hypothetical protein